MELSFSFFALSDMAWDSFEYRTTIKETASDRSMIFSLYNACLIALNGKGLRPSASEWRFSDTYWAVLFLCFCENSMEANVKSPIDVRSPSVVVLESVCYRRIDVLSPTPIRSAPITSVSETQKFIFTVQPDSILPSPTGTARAWIGISIPFVCLRTSITAAP